MFIKRFELHLYKPLLHNNIKHLVVDDLTQETILVAPNGFGKSSTMRELTPYPACRTDYEKHGKKIIEIDHDRSYYILTSDFSKAGSPHSFIKDDVELNQSGTTEVQESLVQQYFAYGPVIDKLLSGEYQICNMSPAARKELIYHTYPSSLTFLLNKYMDLKSRIRVTGNQLKMLNERKAQLTGLLLKEETLQHFEKYRKDLNDALNVLDRELYLMNKTSSDIKHSLQGLQTDSDITVDEIIQECQKISKEMFELTIHHEVDLVVPEKLDRLIGELTARADGCHEQQNELSEHGSKLRDEIEHLRDTLKNDTASAIVDCKKMIQVQQEIYKKNHVDDDTPIVSVEEADVMDENFDLVKNDLQYLQGCLPLISNEEYNNLLSKRELVYATIQQLEPEVKRTELVINELIKKIEGLQNKHSYPLDCRRDCQLRKNLESVLQSYQTELNEYQTSYQENSTKLTQLRIQYGELNDKVEGSGAQRPIILKLETLFTRKSWGNFACSGLSPLEAINLDVTKIINRYRLVIQRSREHAVAQAAKEQLHLLEMKLVKLESTDQPVKEYITKSLIEKEFELTNVGKKLAELDRMVSSTEANLHLYKDHLNLHNRVTMVNSKYQVWKKIFIHQEELKCLSNMIWYLQEVKQQINEKLRELDTIVKEQTGYLTRLKDEIEPSIQEKTVLSKKLSLVAEQLSPTSGIPYRYTVRYVNAILNLANQFIRRVWNYDIELAYFDENKNESFDFTFKLLINHSSEVKDIKFCSKSQKSIINLAMRLAICIYRGYVDQYPIKLDEIDDGCSPIHQDKLTAFLVELLNRKSIIQSFIANQSVTVTGSFTDAGMIVLSTDEALPEHCCVKSKLE